MAFAVSVITLCPGAFPGPLGVSIMQRARNAGIWSLQTVDLRSFGLGRHKTVDDTPAGGGAGMIIRPDVAAAAIDSIPRHDRPLICLSPRGRRLTQHQVHAYAEAPGLILFCGRFEGLDQRVIEARQMQEVSIGDFILAGGEVAAQALIEACIRLLPGVAGNRASLHEESFETGLLEYPHYTLPRQWEGRKTPEILLSGDHEKIREWRLNRSRELTSARRPDLWAAYPQGSDFGASETDDDEHD